MSIIFGYVNFANKPLERTTLETMKKAMDFWGPDGEGVWLDGACGLGNLLYYNTPEALFEKLPVTNADGNLVMTAGARIDNRDELFRIFGIPLGQRLTMPDSSLMLLAYEKWGEACADHLIGDWAMAAWDKHAQKLFLARDHHGITALYYYKGDDFFVFSSSLKGILCLPQVPKKINEYKIAQLLVNWNEGGPTTCYLDIMRLPPAHTLTLYPHHTHISSTPAPTLNRYWYLEHTPEVHLKNNQEYADMFLELYTEAVRCRLRSHRPVGATLSSGLDSGSVCILAARELAKQGKRLQAYTAVPLYDVPAPPNRIGNEGPLALALAEKLGNVDVTLCKAEGIGVLEGIDRKMDVHDQPGFSPGNAYWIVDIFSKCQTDNCGSLLIGQNGNGTVSWPPHSFFIKSDMIRNLFRRLKEDLKFLTGHWAKDFLINDTLIKKYNIKKRIKDERLISYAHSGFKAKTVRIQSIKPGTTNSNDVWFENGVFFKTEVRDPTIDLYLIKFLIGQPSTFHTNRNIFSLNFWDYLSDDIINGKTRGIQSVDLAYRLDSDLDKMKERILISHNHFFFFDMTRIMNKIFISTNRDSIENLLMIYIIIYFSRGKL